MRHASDAYLLLTGPSPSKPKPPILVRPPLPPWPPGDYVRELPWVPPEGRDYYRGDAWSVTIPGMPWVPGASSEYPERVLSWFLDRYTPDWQHKYLNVYAGYQYTHFALSAADSLSPTTAGGPPVGPPGAGQSLQQFVATCKLVKSYGLYAHVLLGSKVFWPHDMIPDAYCGWAFPIMDALMDADCVDEFVPGWEWNLWNVPGPSSVEIFRRIGERAHSGGRSCWSHYGPHTTSWFADGDPRGRFGFYDDLGDTMDGINYQAGAYGSDDLSVPPELRGQPWTPADLQARIVDSLWEFGDREKHGKFVPKFRLWEDVAIFQFDHPHPTEDEANQRGFIGCCTVDNVKHGPAKVWGFGNGGRRPDGSRL